jgi:hypothetical protein
MASGADVGQGRLAELKKNCAGGVGPAKWLRRLLAAERRMANLVDQGRLVRR